MKESEVQHQRVSQPTAVQQNRGVGFEAPQQESLTQLESVVKGSPQSATSVQLVAAADASPTVAAQRRMADLIRNSPAMTAQRKWLDTVDNSHTSAAQAKFANEMANAPHLTAQRQQLNHLAAPTPQQASEEPSSQTAQRAEAPTKPNHTGLPDNLKSGIESLSGLSLDNVKVHYNSSQPAQLNAHAYAQGTDIHVAPGQEKHLPHEAWHVVQQAQGRVKPTMQMKQGVPINDDKSLEHEADVMGAKASQWLSANTSPETNLVANALQRVKNDSPVQLKTMTAVKQELRTGALLANFVMTFITRHLGTGKNDNVSAAEVHARRANPPGTNTVIMDARALKDALVAGAWVDSGDHWSVTTATAIELQNTRKRPGNIGDVPDGAILLGLTGNGAHAGKFTVQGGVITAIEGATAEEVQNAVAELGAYPSGTGARVKSQRRDYRQGLIDHINGQRRRQANNEKVVWVKGYFRTIGGTNMYRNNQIRTVDDINGVASTSQNVTVFVGKNSGNIFHFEA